MLCLLYLRVQLKYVCPAKDLLLEGLLECPKWRVWLPKMAPQTAAQVLWLGLQVPCLFRHLLNSYRPVATQVMVVVSSLYLLVAPTLSPAVS